MLLVLQQNIVSIILLHIVMLFVKFSNILHGLCNLAFPSQRMIIPLSLTTYHDTNFAMDLDDHLSRSGFILFANHGPALWASRKQTSCASSTTKAEYFAASSTTKEIIRHRRLLSNLGKNPTSPTILFTDTSVPSVLSRIMNSIDELNTPMFNTTSYIFSQSHCPFLCLY